MNRKQQIFTRWKTEYDFKTFVNSTGAVASTLIFAVYNGYLGIHHRSLWHGTICIYYLILILLRSMIIAAARYIARRKPEGKIRLIAYISVSVLLLLMNISLIVPTTLMVKQQRPVDMTLIPAIAMAAYTTYKVILASINLKKRRISANVFVRLLRTINFIDALVSILTLQNTLIIVNSGHQDSSMMTVAAASSLIIWIVILVLSLSSIIKGIRKIR